MVGEPGLDLVLRVVAVAVGVEAVEEALHGRQVEAGPGERREDVGEVVGALVDPRGGDRRR